MHRGVYRGGMAQKMSVCTIFGPQTARTEVLVSKPYQPLISPQARYPLSRIALWGPSN